MLMRDLEVKYIFAGCMCEQTYIGIYVKDE